MQLVFPYVQLCEGVGELRRTARQSHASIEDEDYYLASTPSRCTYWAHGMLCDYESSSDDESETCGGAIGQKRPRGRLKVATFPTDSSRSKHRFQDQLGWYAVATWLPWNNAAKSDSAVSQWGLMCARELCVAGQVDPLKVD